MSWVGESIALLCFLEVIWWLGIAAFYRLAKDFDER